MTTLLRNPVANLAIACVIAALCATPAQATDSQGARKSLVRLAADRIDAVFREVAASTRALGEEYQALAARPAPPVTAQENADWIARGISKGSTTAFRTWPEAATPPAFQAAVPGFYSYRGKTVSKETVAQLRNFEQLLPVIRAAYRSFDFSWVYLTTADGMMLIYPYVPIDQAVNNAPPTQQVYYTAADFAGRAVGWTAPYLDLVGAGMMITASYPIYTGDRLLGVASRDITLQQLSRSVLARLDWSDATSAFIVDPHGLAIDASDPELESEIERVNSEKKAAALFYRTPAGLAKEADRGAMASRFTWVNEVSEAVLAKAAQAGGVSEAQAMEINGLRVLAARIESTGWYVVLVERPAGSRQSP